MIHPGIRVYLRRNAVSDRFEPIARIAFRCDSGVAPAAARCASMAAQWFPVPSMSTGTIASAVTMQDFWSGGHG
jgi:hypothetical protein